MEVELTLTEASRFSGRSVRTIRRWIAQGKLLALPRKSGEPPNTPTRVGQLQLASLLDGEVRPDQVSELHLKEAGEVNQHLVEQVVERLMPVLEEIRTRLAETATVEQLQEVQAELAKLSQTNSRPEAKRSPWQRLLRPD